MNIALPLENMSTADKLRTMEVLWDDLCSRSNELIPPNWHSEILSCRELRLEEGKESIIDWNEAKDTIRRSIAPSFYGLNCDLCDYCD
jgi:hypothetical protein